MQPNSLSNRNFPATPIHSKIDRVSRFLLVALLESHTVSIIRDFLVHVEICALALEEIIRVLETLADIECYEMPQPILIYLATIITISLKNTPSWIYTLTWSRVHHNTKEHFSAFWLDTSDREPRITIDRINVNRTFS